MQHIQSIIKDIKNKKFARIYFLMGNEGFYIDLITKELENNVLAESEKAFNLNIFYGKDIDVPNIVSFAKQYPMGAQYNLLIVKEAQHLSRSIEQLVDYAENPQASTILVLNYKYKTLDKRKKLYKLLQKNALVVEFKKLYDNQLPDWIAQNAKDKNLKIDTKSKHLLAEFLGNDLSRIDNELNKLKLVLGENTSIDAKTVEQHIGISKDYNNFELQSAIAKRDLQKCLRIVKYFNQNQKNNPLVLSLAVLYNFFSKLIIYHTIENKTQSNILKALKINPFFVKEYQQGARSFSLKQSTRIISLLRETDLKSKGIGASNQNSADLLQELIMKIMV